MDLCWAALGDRIPGVIIGGGGIECPPRIQNGSQIDMLVPVPIFHLNPLCSSGLTLQILRQMKLGLCPAPAAK